jgi:hypothetical protein
MEAQRFVDLICANPINKIVLERLPALGLADAWLVSGSLFQTAWNVLTDRPPTHAIKDYDVFYFDPDTSWEAEDKIIKAAAELFADVDAEIELRNQSRVHIWYPEKFRTPYPPLRSATEGIDRFLAIACMVGLRPEAGAAPDLYAPHGFDDLEALLVRPNLTPNFGSANYDAKCARWKAAWPELAIEPAP